MEKFFQKEGKNNFSLNLTKREERGVCTMCGN